MPVSNAYVGERVITIVRTVRFPSELVMHFTSTVVQMLYCLLRSHNAMSCHISSYPLPSPHQTGFPTFLTSLNPVSGSMYSFQLTGYIWFPHSLFAITTPNSFLAVEQ